MAQNGAMSTNMSGSSSVLSLSWVWLRFIYSELAANLVFSEVNGSLAASL